jgi:hypothetical protein
MIGRFLTGVPQLPEQNCLETIAIGDFHKILRKSCLKVEIVGYTLFCGLVSAKRIMCGGDF